MKIELLTKEDLTEIKSLLHQILPIVNQAKQTEDKKWIRGKEVQEILGISNTKLQDLRQSGKLTFSQFGNIYYYDIQQVMKELEKNKVKCRDCV